LVTSSQNALVICNTDGAVPYVMDVDVVGGSNVVAGQMLRIIVDYVDEDNYIFVEIKQGSWAENAMLYLYTRIAGVNTLKDQDGHDRRTGSYNVRICVTTDSVLVLMGGTTLASDRVFSDDVSPTGTKVGLGTGTPFGAAGGEANFDDFTFQKHSTAQANCPDCGLPCNGCAEEKMPREIEVEFDGLYSSDVFPGTDCKDCEEYNNKPYILKWDPDLLADCIWSATIAAEGPLCPTTLSAGITVDISVTPTTYRLDVFGPGVFFRLSFGIVKPECSKWVDLDVPYRGEAFICFGVIGPATCTVNSVA
jgi:hypothetical protein